MNFSAEKLVLKLWETLSAKGIGNLLQPWQENELAVSRTEIRQNDLLNLARVENQVNAIKSGKLDFPVLVQGEFKLLGDVSANPDQSTPIEAAANATAFLTDFIIKTSHLEISETMRKEVNVAKAILVAEDILVQDSTEPPEATIEDDWLFLWKEHAGKISSKELQQLWGKVLASELKQPKTYSIRTLDFLKNLSISEAELVLKTAKFVINDRIYRDKISFLEKEGLAFAPLLFLQDIGILTGVESLSLISTDISLEHNKFFAFLTAADKVILLEHEDASKQIASGIILLTTTGKEVLKLSDHQVDEEYLESIAKDYVHQGLKVSIADWVQTSALGGDFSNPRAIEA